MCEGGGRGGEKGGGGAHSTTSTYTAGKDSPAREPSLSAFWLQKPSILRADERVSRGQASERAVCVCVAVSVEKGARRPPLPAPSCARQEAAAGSAKKKKLSRVPDSLFQSRGWF